MTSPASHLIATDIDHTLLNCDGEIVPENIAALQEAQRRGAVVVLATARSYIGALPFYQALGLQTPLIVSNGTLVCDAAGGVLMAETLPQGVARRVVELLTATPHHWSFRDTECAYLHPDFALDRPHFRDTRHYRRVLQACLPEVLGEFDALVSASLFGGGLEGFFGAHDWDGLGLRAAYYPPSHFDPRESMTLTSGRSSKGEALCWLQESLGLRGVPVLALGDAPSDATMFPFGVGVAPANAPEEVRRAATWVAPSCDEGAVAAAVRRFVLEGE